MPFFRWTLPLALVGCTYLSDDDLAERLDLDDDGVPATTDCDPSSPDASVAADYFADGDGDGAGAPLDAQTFCGPPPDGWVANALDQCPDNPALTSPTLWWEDLDGDGVGNPDQPHTDCRSEPDTARAWPGTPDCDDTDPDAADVIDWFVDADGDGVGASGATAEPGCGAPPAGYSVLANDDCDDERALTRALDYYVDDDGDGFGDAVDVRTAALCATSAPAGYADTADDCDDTDDQLFEPLPYYVDGDEDGFGGDTIVDLCERTAPQGYTTASGDCDDEDAQQFPGNHELCDLQDQDCDDEIDEDLAFVGYFVDFDQDGYPSVDIELLCDEPLTGYLPVDTHLETDCDDTDPTAYPGNDEQWGVVDDGVDNDCDPANDRDQDLDGADRYDGDCDDTDPDISPFVREIYYDDIDNDCDPLTRDDDMDGDGYDADADDCDDTNPEVFPGAFEVPLDGINNNCDPAEGTGILCGIDADRDGQGDLLDLLPTDGRDLVDCIGATSEAGLPVGPPDDCDDNEPTTHPGALERCDGIDSNCDGDADSRLISLMIDGELKLPLAEGSIFLPSAGESSLLVEVCSDSADPLQVSLDFNDLQGRDIQVVGRWTGAEVNAFTDRPAITPTDNGSYLVGAIGTGNLHIEGLRLEGDGSADLFLSAEEISFYDTHWDGVEASIDDFLGDATVSIGPIFDVLVDSQIVMNGGRVELDRIFLDPQTKPLIVADGSLIILDSTSLFESAFPLVDAFGSSISAIEVSSYGAQSALYELEQSQLTDLGSSYVDGLLPVFDLLDASMTGIDTSFKGNLGGLIVASGGSTLLSGGDLTNNSGPLVDAVDHDVTIASPHLADGNTADDGALFVLDQGDLTLEEVVLAACPRMGIADLTDGDLEVEGGLWTCEAEGQGAPLLTVAGGDVDLRALTLEGSGGAPPYTLDTTDGTTTLFDVSITARGTGDGTHLPPLPVLQTGAGDLALTDVTLSSSNCDKGKGCDEAVYGVTLLQADSTIVRAKGLSTTTAGVGVDLTNGAVLAHSTLVPFPGGPCFSGETQTHAGARAVQADASSIIDVFGCGTPEQAFFGTCSSLDAIVGVECTGAACICDDGT